MHFYWYWPFARPEELAWASGTARPGERVTVHVIDRDPSPREGTSGPTTVVRDLADVDRTHHGTLRWALSRSWTYVGRERRRRLMWQATDFDLVHLHYVNRFTDVWSPLPRPLVMSVHDLVPHVSRLGDPVERRVLRRLYSRADGLIVHHERLANDLASDFGIGTERIHVVPHQVFPSGSPPTSPAGDGPTVLFFGALRPNKGLEVLDAAMRNLPADIRLVIAGRGDTDVERTAYSMGQRDPRVRTEIAFATLERKRALFRDASVVVLPYTEFASQSGVLHDAYGHGRPVVVTDVGALGDSVREDGTGLVVPPNRPQALAEAIRAVLEPAMWRRCADAARRIAIERSPEATGHRLRAVYDQVL